MSDQQIEIYRQRYETFRHLDKTRWQMLQIAIAVAPLVLAFSVRSNKNLPDWIWVSVGALIFVCGLVMGKVNKGLRNNSIALCEVGNAIGDTWLKPSATAVKSMAFWVSVLMRVAGLGLLSFSTLNILNSL